MMEDSAEESSSDSGMEGQEDSEEEGFDQNFSEMSMEELLKLQEDIGTKAFKQKVLKDGESCSSNSEVKLKKFKRANKNRPREMPLLRRPASKMKSLNPHEKIKKKTVRDPRFDDLSGQLNLSAWQTNFKFLKDMRMKEKEILKNELKDEKDPQKRRKLKLVIQRMENQAREQTRKKQEEEVKKMERQQVREALRKGYKPKVMSAKNRKLLLKTSQFQQLKKENRLDKYMERKEKRQRAKEMKRKDNF